MNLATLHSIKQNKFSSGSSSGGWFYRQKSAEEHRNKTKKQIGHFKVLFLVRQDHSERTGK
jgi:hypothetical protein